ARRLLADSGHPGGRGLPAFELLYNNSETHRVIAEAIQEMWRRELGVRLNLVNEELKSTGAARRALWEGRAAPPFRGPDHPPLFLHPRLPDPAVRARMEPDGPRPPSLQGRLAGGLSAGRPARLRKVQLGAQLVEDGCGQARDHRIGGPRKVQDHDLVPA